MLFWDFKFSGLFWAFENFQATEQAAMKRGLGTVGAASGFQQAVAMGSEASLPAVPPAERAAYSGMTGRKAFALALSRGAEAFMPGRRGGVRKSPTPGCSSRGQPRSHGSAERQGRDVQTQEAREVRKNLWQLGLRAGRQAHRAAAPGPGCFRTKIMGGT